MSCTNHPVNFGGKMSHYTWETTKGVNKYEMDVNCTRIRCVLMLTWSNLQTHFFLRLHFVTPSPPALARLLRPVLSLYIEQELLLHTLSPFLTFTIRAIFLRLILLLQVQAEYSQAGSV